MGHSARRPLTAEFPRTLTIILANDLAHCSEPQAAAIERRGKKRFEVALECHLVHAAPGVADGNAHIASGCDVAMTERPSPLCRSLIYPIAATLLPNP